MNCTPLQSERVPKVRHTLSDRNAAIKSIYLSYAFYFIYLII